MYTVRPTGVVGAEVVAGTVAVVVVVDVVVVVVVVVVGAVVVEGAVVAEVTGASALVEPSVCAGVVAVAVVAAAMSDTSGHSTQPPSGTAHNRTQRHRAAARCRGFFKKCIKFPSYLI